MLLYTVVLLQDGKALRVARLGIYLDCAGRQLALQKGGDPLAGVCLSHSIDSIEVRYKGGRMKVGLYAAVLVPTMRLEDMFEVES